jgi:phosphatidylglycerol:prolipoprotein diacylglycerol transferase
MSPEDKQEQNTNNFPGYQSFQKFENDRDLYQTPHIKGPTTPQHHDLPSKKKPLITPRILSIIFAGLAGLAFFFLYQYFLKVFAGDWVLKQSVTLFEAFELPFLPGIPIGPFELRFYAVCILLGALSGFGLTLFLSKRHFIPDTLIDRLFIGLVIVSVIGARLFYVLFNLNLYEKDWLKIFFINEGGLSIFGAMLAGGLYIWYYCRKFKFNFYEFGDFLSPGLLLGLIIGRFGNFFNYESFGGPTSVYWKMFVPKTASSVHGLSKYDYFHPTFLYEIVPNFLLLLFILFFYRDLTNKRAGVVLSLFLIGYGLIRFVVEFFRVDALKWYFPDFLQNQIPFDINYLMPGQLVALVFFLTGVALLYFRSSTIYINKTMEEIR